MSTRRWTTRRWTKHRTELPKPDVPLEHRIPRHATALVVATPQYAYFQMLCAAESVKLPQRGHSKVREHPAKPSQLQTQSDRRSVHESVDMAFIHLAKSHGPLQYQRNCFATTYLPVPMHRSNVSYDNLRFAHSGSHSRPTKAVKTTSFPEDRAYWNEKEIA